MLGMVHAVCQKFEWGANEGPIKHKFVIDLSKGSRHRSRFACKTEPYQNTVIVGLSPRRGGGKGGGRNRLFVMI
jgi:hypothetical protein